MTEFNIKDFDIIALEKKGKPEVQISKRYIAFTKSLLDEMDNPPYVHILIKGKGDVFAVQACKANDDEAYRFSLPKNEQKKARYCQTLSIKSAIIAKMGDMWDENKFYGCKGTYFPESKAMVFELKDCYLRNV